MTNLITVKTNEEFVTKALHDLEISKQVVSRISENLDTTKTNLYVLSVQVLEDDTIYDITCLSEDFILILQRNLKIHEYHDKFEECIEILKCIKYLKEK